MLLCKTTILQTGLPPPTSIKKNFKRIVLTGITLCLILCVIFSFAACLFGGDDDADPATPGQTEPPSSDTDNPDNSNENDDDYWDDVIVPDDPVIDPDDPVMILLSTLTTLSLILMILLSTLTTLSLILMILLSILTLLTLPIL